MNRYEQITRTIIEKMEQGVVAWHKPWSTGLATSLVSQKPYRGINQLLLGFLPYSSKYYLTYRQAQQLGGHVKKGEKSHSVVFWKLLEAKPEDDDTKKR